MSDIEVLALIRFMLCVVPLPFAIRGRYWILSSVLALAAVLALGVALGLPRVVSALVAIPVYALLAAHTLDITRRRHPRHRRTA